MGETEILQELVQLLNQAVRHADELGMPLASAHICTAIDNLNATSRLRGDGEDGQDALDLGLPN